ncbi:MAG: type VI secretion system membrane subunit TssM [Pseudomonadota bacterium]|nr:type VI secretion system membrane subunit TssM [Pseudomonadota bacterium]
MLNRIWSWLFDPRLIVAVGSVVVLLSLHRVLPPRQFWLVVAVMGVLFTIWLLVSWFQRRRSREQGDELAAIMQDHDPAQKRDQPADREEVQQLRKRMNEAIKTIRKSKLGDRTGRAALYELPWYMMIGNPAAGKSSAIIQSGLRFPFSEQQGGPAIQGVGGTRNCDWFFSTEGILLDTAGRYAVYDEDHDEWLAFLAMLKKNRPRAPINGIIIGVSIAELTSNNPEHAMTLAKNLRSRVQDLTEHLEIFAPVYVVFTKMDLLAGFGEFFDDYDDADRAQVWGATLPYAAHPEGLDAVAQFEQQFDVLYDGLKDLSTTRLALRHQQTQSPSLMTFQMEFQAIRPVLRTLIATLFEDNPFQFKPIFRGFYFTSALQEGALSSTLTTEMMGRFGLQPPNQPVLSRVFDQSRSFFLHDLFSKVILSDRHLVKQHANRKRRQLRYAFFIAAVSGVGLMLGLWTWSYVNNKQLVARVQADLAQVQQIQQTQQGDLAAQLRSLEILQDRLEQLTVYETNRPLSLRFGLYQGTALQQQLRQEYLAGVEQVMLKPVHGNLERFLGEVNANARHLQPTNQPNATLNVTAAQQYADASPTNVEDAYNALKAYLMLGDRTHLDQSHLNDQITRFWRTWLEANRGEMSRSEMIRSAEKTISYALAQVYKSDFPLVAANLALVDQTRDNLRRVVKGMPARDRVYAEIKMRASARYPSITVAQVVGEQNRRYMSGSHVISGTFTRAAWSDYVSKAIDEAATTNVLAQDWVLRSVRNDDLTLTGSPEQIRKQLVSMYKTEYAQEWQRFIQGIHYQQTEDFEQQAELMNRLADPAHSPLVQLFEVFDRETSWDNPTALSRSMEATKTNFFEWIKRMVMQRSPSQAQVRVQIGDGSEIDPNAKEYGDLGTEFLPINNIMMMREDNQNRSFMTVYMDNLAQVRSRFNQIKNAGDIGPGSHDFVKSTLDDGGSELTATLQLVDEQMLAGSSDNMRQALRPLLINPLTQSFTLLLKPAQAEINRTWQAQVYQPFQAGLAQKYPFAVGARLEATPAEIGQFFGANGRISAFVEQTLSPLVIRRGDEITPKTWNNLGIRIEPKFIADFPRYLATPTGGASATPAASGTTGAGQVAAADQTTFQIMPLPVAGLTEYSITIDGQLLRYRNGTQAWTTFVWPNPSSQPGANIRAVNFEGQTVEVFDEPGAYGLEKFISSAQRRDLGQDVFEMSWTGKGTTVSVRFRLISGGGSPASGSASAGGTATSGNSLRGLALPAAVVGSGVTVTAAPVAAPADANAPTVVGTSTPPATENLSR